jgi:hypothetical protein
MHLAERSHASTAKEDSRPTAECEIVQEVALRKLRHVERPGCRSDTREPDGPLGSRLNRVPRDEGVKQLAERRSSQARQARHVGNQAPIEIAERHDPLTTKRVVEAKRSLRQGDDSEIRL